VDSRLEVNSLSKGTCNNWTALYQRRFQGSLTSQEQQHFDFLLSIFLSCQLDTPRRMESTSTPRISGQLIDSYVGRNVMVVGKVTQLRGDTAIIDAEGQVTANLNRVGFCLWSSK
jgi:hypothetical protein